MPSHFPCQSAGGTTGPSRPHSSPRNLAPRRPGAGIHVSPPGLWGLAPAVLQQGQAPALRSLHWPRESPSQACLQVYVPVQPQSHRDAPYGAGVATTALSWSSGTGLSVRPSFAAPGGPLSGACSWSPGSCQMPLLWPLVLQYEFSVAQSLLTQALANFSCAMTLPLNHWVDQTDDATLKINCFLLLWGMPPYLLT